MSDYPKLIDGSNEVYGLPVIYIPKSAYLSAKSDASQQTAIMDQYYWNPPYTPPSIRSIHPKSIYAVILNDLTSPIIGSETNAVHGYQTGLPVVLDDNDKPQRKPGHSSGDKTLDWIDAAAEDELSNIVSVGSYSFAQHLTFFHGAAYVLKLSLTGYSKELYISLQTNQPGGTLWAYSAIYDARKGPSTQSFYDTTDDDKHEYDVDKMDYSQHLTSGSVSVTVRYGKKEKYDTYCLFVYVEDATLEQKLAARVKKVATMTKSDADAYVTSKLGGRTQDEIAAFKKLVEDAQIALVLAMSEAEKKAFMTTYSEGRTAAEVKAFQANIALAKTASAVAHAAQDTAAEIARIMSSLGKKGKK